LKSWTSSSASDSGFSCSRASRLRKDYVDTDAIASVRIAHCFLTGAAKCVWIPDARTRQRREVLHRYQGSVRDSTASVNAFKAFLVCNGVRMGKRNPRRQAGFDWVLGQKDWSEVQRLLLQDLFDEIRHHEKRRKSLFELICLEVNGCPEMKACMKVLGVGVVNGFGLVAIIGRIVRFARPASLVSYLGLNPGRRQSGKGKDIRLGIGCRGRRDMRSLLIQGAQAVLRKTSTASRLQQWGWKLYMRKGNRNVAVAAIARKMAVQIWHLLNGNRIELPEANKALKNKLYKLGQGMGKDRIRAMGFPTIVAWLESHFPKTHPCKT